MLMHFKRNQTRGGCSLQLQQSIWTFVRERIRRYEDRVGVKVAEYELHLTGAGQIEIDILATESANDAAIDEGLEEYVRCGFTGSGSIPGSKSGPGSTGLGNGVGG